MLSRSHPKNSALPKQWPILQLSNLDLTKDVNWLHVELLTPVLSLKESDNSCKNNCDEADGTANDRQNQIMRIMELKGKEAGSSKL
jgi:hypothetical protein